MNRFGIFSDQLQVLVDSNSFKLRIDQSVRDMPEPIWNDAVIERAKAAYDRGEGIDLRNHLETLSR